MSLNNARLYAPIEKTEVQDDGTIKVWGYASAPTEDSDGETITADAMKAALPDYMKFGAVREMHGKSAAGTAIEADVQDDGRTWFGAHVVDPVAVKKVQTKVYKGFSIGGRITARDDLVKTTITGLKLVEVSLVDRPANPDAVFTMFKAEAELSAVETLAKMVNDGEVTPEQLVDLAKASLVAPEPVAKVVVAKVVEAVSGSDTAEKAEAAPDAIVEAPVDAAPAETTVAKASDETPSETPVETVEIADIEKAGARNSAADAGKLQAAHDALVAAGASCASGDKSDAGGDLAKVAAVTAERDDALAKAAKLTARVAELEARPLDGKAILKALGKPADVIEAAELEPATEKVIGYDGKVDPIATMIKSIHASAIGRAL